MKLSSGVCLFRLMLHAAAWVSLVGAVVAQPVVLPPPGAEPPPEFMGRVAVEMDVVPEIIKAKQEEPVVEEVPFEEELIAPTKIYSWYNPAYWFGPQPWDIGFELGINGNEGINESLSLRAGGHLKRETKHWKFDTSIVYNRNNANGVETQNNALVDVRIDRKLGDSPWSLFILNQELYDEFQAFDLRVSLNSGLGYQLIDTETLDLLTRFGAGASHEFGAVNEEWAYEALFGMDYEHKYSATQRFTATFDYFPEWEDFSQYRIVTDLGWEIDLDRPNNLSLKFSVIDRYDSTPEGVDPNEINYAALLIWGL